MSEEPRIGSEPKRSLMSALLGIIGILLYAMAGWLYPGTGLVMPYPWVYGLWAIWVAGVFVLVRVVKRSPAWTPVVPVAAVVIWVALVQLGSWLFGWTA
ncbi:MAG: hypothetical protein ACXW15_10715 [Acidimicrobiia bacterium]